MMSIHDSARARRSRWYERARTVRGALAASALVFAVLWATGTLAPLPALGAFAAIAVVLLITAAASVPPPGRLQVAMGAAAPDERLIEAVLAGLPDPVVALDRTGEVIALNAQASLVAPGLRRGEPV